MVIGVLTLGVALDISAAYPRRRRMGSSTMPGTLLSGAFIAWRCAGGGGTSGAFGMHMRGITFPAGRYFSGYRRSKSTEITIGIIWRTNLGLGWTALDMAALATGALLLLAPIDIAPVAEAVQANSAIVVHRFRSA